MAKPVQKETFGKTSKGEEIYKFTLSNANGVSVGILNFGCVVHSINLPDKQGKCVDVNLGFDNVKDYEENYNYFGALCGRVANRIGDAEMTLDGSTYKLSKNDSLGGHFVHGGFVGFSRRVWEYKVSGDSLTLSYTDADGSEGIPGQVTTHVTYSLDKDNTLTMDYTATTTKTTVIDMGSHFMVNLGGHGAGPIKDHVITVAADKYVEMGNNFLPTGKIIPVTEDKVMDFRKARPVDGDVLETLTGNTAFHHAFVYDNRGQKKFMARVDHPASKRFMEVYSTNSTVFAYSNHYMDIIMKGKACKDGVVYKQYGAIEFMPMGYPNSVKMPSFPQSVVRPGETYNERAWYKFGVAQ